MKTAVCFLACCALAYAQQNSASRVAPAQPEKRDSFVVRLLRPLEAQPYSPMSKSRLRSYIEDTVGPSTILREGAAAGIGQAKNSPPEWGGGVEGYAKRFGSDMAELAVRNSIAYPLAAALHEDHRYFASGKTSVRGRFWHAALSPFEARRPDGSVGFSYSNVAAVAGASIISRAWAPPSWDTPGNAVADFGLTLAGEAAFNVFREFLPDFLHRRH